MKQKINRFLALALALVFMTPASFPDSAQKEYCHQDPVLLFSGRLYGAGTDNPDPVVQSDVILPSAELRNRNDRAVHQSSQSEHENNNKEL